MVSWRKELSHRYLALLVSFSPGLIRTIRLQMTWRSMDDHHDCCRHSHSRYEHHISVLAARGFVLPRLGHLRGSAASYWTGFGSWEDVSYRECALRLWVRRARAGGRIRHVGFGNCQFLYLHAVLFFGVSETLSRWRWTRQLGLG